MRIFTFSNARQQLATVLNMALDEGQVYIRRRDGSTFVIKPENLSQSPLDVPAVTTGISLKSIQAAIDESRKR